MPSGGARPGSGRKKRAVKFASLKTVTDAELESIVRDEVPSALRELVRGHYKSETGRDGEERVYRVSPNVQAIIAVLDRALGKVTDKHEFSGDVTVSIEAIKAIRQRLAND